MAEQRGDLWSDTVVVATPEGVELRLTLAGLGSRFVATVIDLLLRAAVFVAGIVALQLPGGVLESFGARGPSVAARSTAIGVVLFLFLLLFGYDVVFETLAGGRTPGKRAAGLRVVRADGGPVGFRDSAIRNIVRLVDWLPAFYGIGIVAILAGGRNQRLGDVAAGTLVVRERAGRATRKHDVDPSPAVFRDAVETWDVSAVSAQEAAAVRSFLERRASLTDDARARLAGELAARLRPKVSGARADAEPEDFLEGLAAAKAARS